MCVHHTFPTLEARGGIVRLVAQAVNADGPTLEAVRAARARLGDLVLETPVRQWQGRAIEREVGAETRVYLKEELFQRAGSFKPRGALTVMLDLSKAALAKGVTAVSAGNHAMAVAYAAGAVGTTAKVVMPRSANPFRVQSCQELGAEVELVDDVHQAFARVKEIEAVEGRTFVHPFEGPLTALGTRRWAWSSWSRSRTSTP
jgi:threonine dehydratase